MFTDTKAISSFSTDDLARAKEFYSGTLGLRTSDVQAMPEMLTLHLGGDQEILVYEKADHSPASFTILNFPVKDVGAAVDELVRRGVTFERYDRFEQDDRGILRQGGVAAAWFTDPAGNILAVLEQE